MALAHNGFRLTEAELEDSRQALISAANAGGRGSCDNSAELNDQLAKETQLVDQLADREETREEDEAKADDNGSPGAEVTLAWAY